MKNNKQKLYRYFIIIGFSITIGLISYPFHKSDKFKLFKVLPIEEDKRIKISSKQLENIFNKSRYSLDFFKNYEKHNTYYSENYTRYSEIKEFIDFDEAKFLNISNLAIFIDARSAEEIDDNKIRDSIKTIPNAIHIPVEHIDNMNDNDYFEAYFDLESMEIEFLDNISTIKFLESIKKDLRYVVYCGHKDCDKSEDLAFYMKNNFDFQYVSIYKGGWKEWNNPK